MDTQWIITVDGVATDIRGTSDLAIRQGKVQKSRHPDKVVEIHYGEAYASVWHNGKKLVVDIVSNHSNSTRIATVLEA